MTVQFTAENPSITRRHLGAGRELGFEIVPDAAQIAEISEALGLSALRKTRFEGTLTPVGEADWQMDARVSATVVQPCGITLEPVTTRIEAPYHVLFTPDFAQPEAEETEMPEDETVEPLGNTINLIAQYTSALSLHVPDFPRKEGIAFEEQEFAPENASAEEERPNPFAQLEALKSKLSGEDKG